MDQKWTEMPGIFRTNRRTGVKKFLATVSNILINLAPAEIFNPSILWLNEKEKIKRQLVANDEEDEEGEEEEVDQAAISTAAELKKVEFKEDVARIRTDRESKENLLNLLQEMRSIKSRFVLLMQILHLNQEQAKIYYALQPVDELIRSSLDELEGLKTVEEREIGDRSRPKKLKTDEGWKKTLAMIEEKREKCAGVSKNIAVKGDKVFVENVLQIRNSKKSLFSQLKKMKSLKTRLILMVELLQQAFNPACRPGEVVVPKWEDVYDILWAIDEMLEKYPELNGKFEEEMPPIPELEKTQRKTDRSLVFDNYANVERLLQQVRDRRANEKDPIKLQLVDMFDKLPPLSKYTFGYRLDPWQKRVLTWIDEGKSTIICAPTSSGKTVLSSYAALPKSSQDMADKASFNNAVNELNVVEEDKKEEDQKEEELHVDGEEQEFSESESEDEEESDDEEDAELNRQAAALKKRAHASNANGAAAAATEDLFDEADFSPANAKADRYRRLKLLSEAAALNMNRVLFVVPTEPLVWQVGAYFSSLLKQEGDRTTKVAIVTDQLVYHPLTIFGQMPQIVVGTPQALETELTKCRGRIGYEEYYRKAARSILPGGFDHFDWVIYDEVHALDGEEGQALQRLIRSMNCKFLALSATVGNAEQLRGWMESVRGEQLDVETITVRANEVTEHTALPAPPTAAMEMMGLKKTDGPALTINVHETQGSRVATISTLRVADTVKDLREAISAEWATHKDTMQDVDMTADSLQLFLGDPSSNTKAVDLASDKEKLEFYGFTTEKANEVTVYTHVNLITHSGRFINLQRYVWNQPLDKEVAGVLSTISPLSAIDSVSQLEGGILEGTALSFTSRDSYYLWKKLEQIYPAVNVADVNPKNFFAEGERITLQRTKDYEDLMKSKLRQLASQFPLETQELLQSFSLEDPESTELDLCELVLDLKAKDMTPCLPFHLNSFEAIRLFKSLLSGLEKRQADKHPNYYTKKKNAEKANEKAANKEKKDFGGDAKAMLDAAKAGDLTTANAVQQVDLHEPHPDFCAGNRVPPVIDLDRIAAEMETYDGFRDKYSKAGTKLESVRAHALMRGLRRGIGLFIREVSFPAYRRAVMRLASKGELAVVISDDSLAFGVNMPFRTCIFCGEMYDRVEEASRLTPLMAQQMSGRAGRRGLDQQGNLVYVGSRANFIRQLMMGKVSQIVGRDPMGRVIEPRYPALVTQTMLSSRFTGIGRTAIVGGETLHEYVERDNRNALITNPAEKEKKPSQDSSYTFTKSRELMSELGFVDDGEVVPADKPFSSYQHLALIWTLRDFGVQGITLGMLLTDMYYHLKPTAHMITEKKTEADKAKMVDHRDKFTALLLCLVDRREYVPPKEGVPAAEAAIPALQDNPYFNPDDKKKILEDWEKKFADLQERLPEEVKDPVKPGKKLDGTLFACLLDRNLCQELSDNTKQLLKDRYWSVGQIVRHLHNCTWTDDEMYKTITLVTRNVYLSIRYLNGELIRGMVDFINVSDISYEKKDAKEFITKKAAAAAAAGGGSKESVTGNSLMAHIRDIWQDEQPAEMEASNFVSSVDWAQAMGQLFKQLPTEGELKLEDLKVLQGRFMSVAKSKGPSGDRALLSLMHKYPAVPAVKELQAYVEALGKAVRTCGQGAAGMDQTQEPYTTPEGREMATIGVLNWFSFEVQPILASKMAVVLQLLYDAEPGLLSEEAIKAWYAMDSTEFEKHLPAGASCGLDAVNAMKKAPNMKEFIEWLDEAEDESDEVESDGD